MRNQIDIWEWEIFSLHMWPFTKMVKTIAKKTGGQIVDNDLKRWKKQSYCCKETLNTT